MQLAISTGLHEFDELSELRLVGLAAMVSKLPWALYILAVTSPVQFGPRGIYTLGHGSWMGSVNPKVTEERHPAPQAQKEIERTPPQDKQICLQQKYMNIYSYYYTKK